MSRLPCPEAASYERTTDALPGLSECPHYCDGVVIGRANNDSMDLTPANASRPCEATLLSSRLAKISSDMETNRGRHSNDGISFVTPGNDRLERGQAPLPDLFYFQLRKSSNGHLNQKIEQVRKRGLPPLVEKVTSNTLMPHCATRVFLTLYC